MYREKFLPFFVTVVIFFLFTVYLFARRGYYTLYIANKAFGSTAAVLAAITLAIGPLARMNALFDQFVILRKPLGLIALGLALLHAIISVFLLPTRFPIAWYRNEWIPIGFGAIVLVVWAYLTWISQIKIIKKLDPSRWRQLQSFWAKIAFLAIFLHLTIMKYPGWIRWFQGKVTASADLANPTYPPASLFVFFILLGVLIVRGLFLKR